MEEIAVHPMHYYININALGWSNGIYNIHQLPTVIENTKHTESKYELSPTGIWF